MRRIADASVFFPFNASLHFLLRNSYNLCVLCSILGSLQYVVVYVIQEMPFCLLFANEQTNGDFSIIFSHSSYTAKIIIT